MFNQNWFCNLFGDGGGRHHGDLNLFKFLQNQDEIYFALLAANQIANFAKTQLR